MESQQESRVRNKLKYYCSVCKREINREDYKEYDGMCWECWGEETLKDSKFFGDDLS